MEKLIERYELLCKDVKHQIRFVDDVYVMDFTYLIDTLKEMSKLKKQILQKEFNYYKDSLNSPTS
jgi:hypothetical protein